jgi:hypothetical protein
MLLPRARGGAAAPLCSRPAACRCSGASAVLDLAELSAGPSLSADRALPSCSTAVLGPLPCPAAAAQAPSGGGAPDARARRALAALRPGGPAPTNIVTRRARLGGWRAAAPIVVGSERRALCAAGSGLGSASGLALAPWSGVASPLWPGALASPLPSLLLLVCAAEAPGSGAWSGSGPELPRLWPDCTAARRGHAPPSAGGLSPPVRRCSARGRAAGAGGPASWVCPAAGLRPGAPAAGSAGARGAPGTGSRRPKANWPPASAAGGLVAGSGQGSRSGRSRAGPACGHSVIACWTVAGACARMALGDQGMYCQAESMPPFSPLHYQGVAVPYKGSEANKRT